MEGDDYCNTEEAANWSGTLNVSQLCRVCANPKSFLIPIFEGEGLYHELGMKIEKHLPIQVCEDDSLPKQICYHCASTLIAWHDLVTGCVKADQKIRQLQKEEEEEDDEEIDDDKGVKFYETQSLSDTASIQPSTSANVVSNIQIQNEVRKATPSVKRGNTLKEKITKFKIIAVQGSATGPSSHRPTSKSTKTLKSANLKDGTNEESGTSERSLEHQSLSATMKSKKDLEDKYSSSDTYRNQTVSITDTISKDTDFKVCISDDSGTNNTEDHHCYSVYVKTDDESEYHLCDVKEIENALQISESDRSVSISYNGATIGNADSQNEEGPQNFIEDSCLPCNNSELTDHNYVQLINSTPDISSVLANVDGAIESLPGLCSGRSYFSKCAIGILGLPWGMVLPKPPSSTRLVSCKYCKKAFKSEAVLQTHVRMHTGVTPFYCKYCGKSFRLSLSLKQHLIICNEVSDENNEFSHPLTKGHDNHFVCTLCGKKYKLKPSLKEHLRAHMGKARLKLKCEVCGKKFLKKAEVLEHMKSHENLVLYSCEMCDKGFINERDLQDHNISHSDVRPFSCSICGATYKRKSHLTRHVLNHSAHHKRVRAPQIRRKPGEEFKCEICGKISTTKRLLMLHMISHSGERNYECSVCGKRFAQSGAMSRHIHTVHGGAKDYSCEICQQSFTAKATKENHMRIHTGEKPYQCVTCGKTFRTQQQHRVHENIHSDARPYPCPYCTKCFRRRPHLVVHIRTHTGEKPYVCPMCGRGFAQKNDMTKHLNIHNR